MELERYNGRIGHEKNVWDRKGERGRLDNVNHISSASA